MNTPLTATTQVAIFIEVSEQSVDSKAKLLLQRIVMFPVLTSKFYILYVP